MCDLPDVLILPSFRTEKKHVLDGTKRELVSKRTSLSFKVVALCCAVHTPGQKVRQKSINLALTNLTVKD